MLIVHLYPIQDDGIEIEHIEENPIVNIDSPDERNVLAVVEYVDDIHAFYKKTEVRHDSHYSRTLVRTQIYLNIYVALDTAA